MTEQEIEAKVNTAVFETIAGLIPIYFKMCKALLFLIAIVFSLVFVGVMVAGRIFIAAIHLVSEVQAQRARKLGGVSA